MASIAVKALRRASLMGSRLHNSVFSSRNAALPSAVTKSSSAEGSSAATFCSGLSRSVTTTQIGHCLRMASTWQHTVTMDNLNPAIKTMEYAVRGPLVIRATEIEKEIQRVSD